MDPQKSSTVRFVAFLASTVLIGLVCCGTLDLIAHARIYNDVIYPTGAQYPILDQKSAEVIDVDGKAAQTAPLASLDDSGPHAPAWVSAGMHVFKVKVTPMGQRTGVANPTKYVTFSAAVQSGTNYLLVIVNDKPALFVKREGPGKNSFPPFNHAIPVTLVAEGNPAG